MNKPTTHIGRMIIRDEFGEMRFFVTRIEDGCYYFTTSNMRYNKEENRVEEFTPMYNAWVEWIPAHITEAIYLSNEDLDNQRRFKVLFSMQSPAGGWTSACMTGFGKGFTYSEACTLKTHLESSSRFKSIKIVDLNCEEVTC